MARNIKLTNPTTKIMLLAMMHLFFSQVHPFLSERHGDFSGPF